MTCTLKIFLYRSAFLPHYVLGSVYAQSSSQSIDRTYPAHRRAGLSALHRTGRSQDTAAAAVRGYSTEERAQVLSSY